MQFLKYDIEHHASYPWQFVQDRTCFIKIKCNEKVQRICVVYGDPFWFAYDGSKEPVLHQAELCRAENLLGDQFYSIAIPMQTHKLRYHFLITLESGQTVCLSELGVTESLAESQLRPFFVPYVFEREHYAAPKWAEGLVWYQIFPDRFDNGHCEDASDFVPDRENFYGGTLDGICNRIPHLNDLGVQGVYLNPVFASLSNHRYDTIDYSRIAPAIGDRDSLRRLVETLHDKGMKIMLDGVFNHCGWEHPYWQDVLVNGTSSRYYRWFYINDAQCLYNSKKEAFPPKRIQDESPFECFAFAANMPKWNTENPEVMDYLIGEATKWTSEFGIDAWRLDVPDEVSENFLREFRRRMRTVNEDIYIIGEIWQNPAHWIDGAIFDGTMDYPLYYAVRDFAMFGEDSLTSFAQRICQTLVTPEIVRKHMWAFCSNHDIPRVRTLCHEDESRVELSYFLCSLLGGGMSIYYGDEFGIAGGEDPDNRRAVPWNAQSSAFLRELTMLKKRVLKDSCVMSVKLQDALYITLNGSRQMLAVITSPDQTVYIGNGTPVFGHVEKTDQGYAVNGYGLFYIDRED